MAWLGQAPAAPPFPQPPMQIPPNNARTPSLRQRPTLQQLLSKVTNTCTRKYECILKYGQLAKFDGLRNFSFVVQNANNIIIIIILEVGPNFSSTPFWGPNGHRDRSMPQELKRRHRQVAIQLKRDADTAHSQSYRPPGK